MLKNIDFKTNKIIDNYTEASSCHDQKLFLRKIKRREITVWPDDYIILTTGPFKTMEIRQKAYQFTKDGITFSQKLILAFRNCPKTCRILPNWRYFAKSGHTGT